MTRIWSRNRNTEQSDLAVKPGSALKRDVYKAATAGLTGVTAFGALAVTGAVAGTAAHAKALDDAGKVAPPAAATPEVVTKRRAHRTVVRTRIVHAASSGAVASPGTGGTVSSSSTSHSSGHTSTYSAPKPAAPKPAPKPAPAPSSGS